MLKIREEQMEALRGYCDRLYAEGVAQRLRKKYPDATRELERSTLVQHVLSSMENVVPFGITGKRSVEKYIELTMVWGADFPESPQTPWAPSVLAADLPQDVKVQVLWDKTRAAHKSPA